MVWSPYFQRQYFNTEIFFDTIFHLRVCLSLKLLKKLHSFQTTVHFNLILQGPLVVKRKVINYRTLILEEGTSVALLLTL